MTTDFKFIAGTVIASLSVLLGAVFFLNQPEKVISRNDILPGSTAVLGTSKTKVYLVEFSDFQCPACGMYKPYVDEVLKKHKENIVFGYRHFPLPQHASAEYAAYGAEAAGKQGKFWEMYDYLFANQQTLSPEVIDQGAEKLGLNMAQYRADVSSESVKKKVEEDKAAGMRFGVNSTPTFFLNGKKLQLRSPDDLLPAIKDAVREQQ